MARDLRELLRERDTTHAATGLLIGRDRSTISKIAAGVQRARPTTVVALAKIFGIDALRMRDLCDAHWYDAHPEERADLIAAGSRICV